MKKRYLIPVGLVAVAVAASSCALPEATVGAEHSVTSSQQAPAVAEAAAPAPAPEEPRLTVSQENARESADSYLDMSGFSRSGLIEQLEFEGYPKADATFGVDSLNVDWNKQAERSAQAYLDTSAFSRDGLIEQLEFEGFTTEQATHGVTANGL